MTLDPKAILPVSLKGQGQRLRSGKLEFLICIPIELTASWAPPLVRPTQADRRPT